MDLSTAASQLKQLLNNLPLPDERIPEAERLIKECSDAELSALGLGPPPRPTVPRAVAEGGKGGDGKPGGGPQQRLHVVQAVINSLQYNHTAGYYYNVSKSRPYSRIMDTAREALRAALPIKCLEAVFLGALLTAGWQELDRMPLAFKSTVQGQTYRHIVLVVFHAPSRKWGALGLSRRPELMDKDLVYDSLADLVSEYKTSYERWWHALARVYVGLPLEHDTYYAGAVCWRYLTLSLSGRKSWASHRSALDKFAGQARKLAGKFRAMGGKPATEGSLGGPEQQQQQGQATAAGNAAGGGGGGAGGGSSAAATGPAVYTAAAAARHAKSVSPTRRRPPPAPLPPPPRRPLTPSRTSAAAAAGCPGSPVKATAPGLFSPKSATPSSPSPGSRHSVSTATASATASASTIAIQVSIGAVAAVAVAAATAPGLNGTGADAADGAVGGTDYAALPPVGGGYTGSVAVCDGGGADRSGRGGGDGGSPEQAAATSNSMGAVAGSSSGGFGGGDGEGGQSAGRELRGERSRGGQRRARPRRSSDPGSLAAVAAAEAASGPHRGASARAQARLLRQQVRAEEQGEMETGPAPRYGEDEEETESDEGDYLSENDG